MQRGHPYPMQQLFPNASRIEALRIFKFFFRPFLSFIFIYFHPPRTSARTHTFTMTYTIRSEFGRLYVGFDDQRKEEVGREIVNRISLRSIIKHPNPNPPPPLILQ